MIPSNVVGTCATTGGESMIDFFAVHESILARVESCKALLWPVRPHKAVRLKLHAKGGLPWTRVQWKPRDLPFGRGQGPCEGGAWWPLVQRAAYLGSKGSCPPSRGSLRVGGD